jgi:hypothetical protein
MRICVGHLLPKRSELRSFVLGSLDGFGDVDRFDWRRGGRAACGIATQLSDDFLNDVMGGLVLAIRTYPSPAHFPDQTPHSVMAGPPNRIQNVVAIGASDLVAIAD